tara:strand:+ start:2001 stop:3587 length:1587 start_codon:yes stop_codon:yes gene_type:complete
MEFNVVVAYTFSKNGIGKQNGLPWNIKKDMNRFVSITKSVPEDENIKYINSVIMGRTTWESIPEKFRPLKDRLNIIITNTCRTSDNPFVKFIKWDELKVTLANFKWAKIKDANGKIYQIYNNYIIGGESIYYQAMNQLTINTIYSTEIYYKFECDTTFPDIDTKKYILKTCSPFMNENSIYFRFMNYQNTTLHLNSSNILNIGNNNNNVNNSENNNENNNEVNNNSDISYKKDIDFLNHEEENYLNLMLNIVQNGIERKDRTGTGTISLFGTQLKYDLSDTFPISTTKKMFFRAIFEELMLYLRGFTDNKILQEKGIHIWDGNTTRQFLDGRGLNEYPEGDMGETYGFNFRHFGGKYKDCHQDYTGQGFDQLTNVIELIKTNPESRRIIINLWNPDGNQRAALPSCLCKYQFYVDTQRNKLHLQIYIRSSDYFLAYNWNTCTGAIFVHLICNLEGINLSPGTLTVVTGDTHIYKNHLKQVTENLTRKPYPFPKLVVKNKQKDITKFEFTDLELLGYRFYHRIAADMAV